MSERSENKRKPAKRASAKARRKLTEKAASAEALKKARKPFRAPAPISPVKTSLPSSFPTRDSWPKVYPFADRVHHATSTFADQFFGGNPFPEDDTRHELWETNARYMAEEIARMKAVTLGKLPANTAASEQFLAYVLDSAEGVFDILSKQLLVVTISGPDSAILYEQLLTRIIEHLQTKLVPDKGLFGLSKEEVLSELRIRFSQRKAHWMAEALKLVRTSEDKTAKQARAIPLADEISLRIQNEVEERFRKWAAELVTDRHWEEWRARLVQLSNLNAQKHDLHIAIIEFTEKYKELLETAVVDLSKEIGEAQRAGVLSTEMDAEGAWGMPVTSLNGLPRLSMSTPGRGSS